VSRLIDAGADKFSYQHDRRSALRSIMNSSRLSDGFGRGIRVHHLSSADDRRHQSFSKLVGGTGHYLNSHAEFVRGPLELLKAQRLKS
jgi:hypothetical protein